MENLHDILIDIMRTAAQKPETKPDPKPESKPRWKCRNCGSTEIEVQYGVWYTETADFNLTETGSETSGVEYFYCNDCDLSDSGEPDENV